MTARESELREIIEGMTMGGISSTSSYWGATAAPQPTPQKVTPTIPGDIQVGDTVKVIDVGSGYNQHTRDRFIGRYCKVEEIGASPLPLGWYREVALRSIDPAEAADKHYLSYVRLKKFIKPEEVKREDVGKVTQ